LQALPPSTPHQQLFFTTNSESITIGENFQKNYNSGIKPLFNDSLIRSKLAAILVDKTIKGFVLFQVFFILVGQLLGLLFGRIFCRAPLLIFHHAQFSLFGILPVLLLLSQIFPRDFPRRLVVLVVADLLAGVLGQRFHLRVRNGSGELSFLVRCCPLSGGFICCFVSVQNVVGLLPL
jgi:hypothetical protein